MTGFVMRSSRKIVEIRVGGVDEETGIVYDARKTVRPGGTLWGWTFADLRGLPTGQFPIPKPKSLKTISDPLPSQAE